MEIAFPESYLKIYEFILLESVPQAHSSCSFLGNANYYFFETLWDRPLLEELGWEFIRALGISDLPRFQALPDEGDIIQGAAGLGAPLPRRVRRAGIVVGPGGQDRV